MMYAPRRDESLGVYARRLLRQRTVRYVLVGGSVYLFELAVIVVAERFGTTPTVAVTISFLLGLAVSFLLQKLVAFEDKRLQRRIILSQLVAVVLLVLWNLAFTLLITGLLQDYVSPVITRTIALLITTIWNYYLYKTRIFHHEPA